MLTSDEPQSYRRRRRRGGKLFLNPTPEQVARLAVAERHFIKSDILQSGCARLLNREEGMHYGADGLRMVCEVLQEAASLQEASYQIKTDIHREQLEAEQAAAAARKAAPKKAAKPKNRTAADLPRARHARSR